jgi:hypothetical protein
MVIYLCQASVYTYFLAYSATILPIKNKYIGKMAIEALTYGNISVFNDLPLASYNILVYKDIICTKIFSLGKKHPCVLDGLFARTITGITF